MRRADEAAEQPALVGAALEHADPPPADQIAPFPVAPRRLVEMRAQQALVDPHILRAVRLAEEAAEMRVVGQLLHRDLLQPVERDMRGVEVDRGDLRGVGGQIGEHVAAAARDGGDVAVRRDRQRLHVDYRVFPDLGIDEAPEGEGEGALQQPFLAHRLMIDDGAIDDMTHWRGSSGGPVSAALVCSHVAHVTRQ